MKNIIVAAAIVAVFAGFSFGAVAAERAKGVPFAELTPLSSKLYKVTDPANGATCYVLYFSQSGAALDCLK